MTTNFDPIEAEERFAAITNDMIPANLVAIARRNAAICEKIFGREATDSGMNVMLNAAQSVADDVEDWRETLDDDLSVALELPGAAALHGLSAYAFAGAFPAGQGEPEATGQAIQATIRFAEDLLSLIPAEWYEDIADLKNALNAAAGRWALDHGQGLTIAQIAALADVSEKSIRNNISDPASPLRQEAGKIPHDVANEWLNARDGFMPSTWHMKTPAGSALETAEPLDPVFVPVAKDGSWFHPDCRASDGYFRIGKDDRKVADYDAALRQLQAMPTPQWRRPGASGTPGRVAGIRWERRSKDAVEARSAA